MLQSLGALTLGVLSCLVSERSTTLRLPAGRTRRERAWREWCWPPASVPALWGRCVRAGQQRLGGHSSPSRYLMKKNQRSQPTALLRPQIHMTPVVLTQTAQLLNHPSQGRQSFCEARIIHPCCALPELVTHKTVSTVCDYRSTAINNQTPGNRLAGWA